jgi:TPR repeat protein
MINNLGGGCACAQASHAESSRARGVATHNNSQHMRAKSDRLFNEACVAWDCGNLSRAFELFSRAAESGDASCQLNLGYFYDCGLHVAQNRKLAQHWYRKAYHQGEASAASNIATICRDTHDYGRMIWWWRAAARLGDGDALLELARCYEAGRGVLRNRERAAQFYFRSLASPWTTDASREAARCRLNHLRRQMARHRDLE